MQSCEVWERMLRERSYGDIETQEGGDIYRGPLKEIRIEGDSICFNSDWMAKTPGMGKEGFGKWKLCEVSSCSISKNMFRPQNITDGRIAFQLPGIGLAVIFPKDGSKLNSRQVEGRPDYDPNFRPESLD